MVYEYLKDCYTITCFSWAGSAFKDTKHHVSLDKGGLPRIIPIELRRCIVRRDRAVFLSCITFLALHRAISWWPKVDLSTVTAPFCGRFRSLDRSVLLKGMYGVNALAGRKIDSGLKMLAPRFLNILTSSPNGRVSLSSSWLDAGAFLYHPKTLFALLRWNYSNKGHTVNLVLLALVLCSVVLELIAFIYSLYIRFYLLKYKRVVLNQQQRNIYYYRMFKGRNMGKLSIVRDVPGKSRVVGITNYWIQVSLKPLHDAILKLLKEMPTDGTYDQEGVINRLPNGPSEKYSSYDLSAATDRLPIDVQKDVLSLFIGKEKSELWSKILDIPFNYGDEQIKYAVGQPMGAYSSWAMLALTHHIIVNSLYEPFEKREYAVLGDDMTIRPNKGEAYVSIMEGLGVQISQAKSLTNSGFIEFAKKLFDKNLGYMDACLGPKLVLKSIQTRLLKVTLLHDSYKRAIYNTRDLFMKLSSNPKDGIMSFGFYLLFGPWGLVEPSPNSALSNGVIRRQYRHDLSDREIFFNMYEALGQILLRRYRNNKVVAFKTLSSYFSQYCWSRIPRYPTPLQIGVVFMFLISPGCWIPFCTYREDLLAASPLKGMAGDNLGELLEKIELTPLSSDGQPSRKTVQDMRAFVKSVSKEFDKAHEYQLDSAW
ncbi:RNA-dependent RNA polymerase [Erysiphe necator associated mitovirus 15]|nr:RNA-dependent RNA polymerase [Erysiphe necator associated mitovirus 15]